MYIQIILSRLYIFKKNLNKGFNEYLRIIFLYKLYDMLFLYQNYYYKIFH